MEIISKINSVLNLQEENKRNVPVDLVLKNGNLQVRAFQITKFDETELVLEGLTRLEIYSSLREKREPVLCKFKVDELKEVLCEEFDYQLV